jgi:serine/threonine protein kinase
MLSELVDGRNLRSLLSQGIPLPYQEAMQIARQVTEALEDGHQQGLPNLSLRPSNIMLNAEGVKLVNYGISRLTAMDRNKNRHTKLYMDDYLAPEQLDRQGGDERSDIYALGTVLYEMLIGHPPSVGRFYYPSEVNIEATEAVDILIDHARENKPERRFATVKAMRTEMDRITMASLKKGPIQYLRVALAKVSQFYKKLTSTRRGITLLIIGLVALLAMSISLDTPSFIRTPARIIMPLLLNSILVSILCEWVIGALARRRGLGSLSTSGGGIGAILGLVFTLNLIVLLTVPEISFSVDIVSDYLGLLTFAIFETAFSLGIMVVSAWLTDRFLKSYTTGFYVSFMLIVILEIILTLMQQPKYLIGG